MIKHRRNTNQMQIQRLTFFRFDCAANFSRFPRAVIALALLFPMVCISGQESTSQQIEGDFTFGVTQVYEASDAVWVFLDVEIVGDRQGSGPRHRQRLAFVALKAAPDHALEILRSCDPDLTANSHNTRFIMVERVVYAVRRDMSKVWKIRSRAHPNGGIFSGSPEDYVSVLKIAAQADAADEEEKEGGSNLKLKAKGNYGYSDGPVDAFESETLGVNIAFRREVGKLGWNGLAISYDRRKNLSLPDVVLTVEDLLPAGVKSQRKDAKK